VFVKNDGRVVVRTPCISRNDPKGFTEDDALKRALATVPKDATQTRVIDESQVPVDRTFRNAWKADLTVDMPKAREIHREHLRALRAPLLVALDAEYLRADERGDLLAKQEIAAKKQALRDVTADPAIEVTSTPEELKAAIPEALQ
jgi:hypothetical protein